ncbi:MAG: hypothetical protein MAG451_01013 [Anaerolineales bacterium]|nr:hypothetical protein [Anaerolineales bacterium]
MQLYGEIQVLRRRPGRVKGTLQGASVDIVDGHVLSQPTPQMIGLAPAPLSQGAVGAGLLPDDLPLRFTVSGKQHSQHSSP